MELRKLPKMPEPSLKVTQVVRAMDKIRDGYVCPPALEHHDEFSWFAREYPRCYRHHLSHASFRLQSMYSLYEATHIYASAALSANRGGGSLISFNIGQAPVEHVYWDFEAFLGAIGSALDVLARIVGLAFDRQTPSSFNKLCAQRDLDGPVSILRLAKREWVETLKDYRDCFVHYTPVDTLLYFEIKYGRKTCYLHARLPSNPNARDITEFRFRPAVDVLHYTVGVYRQMICLDQVIAKELLALYDCGAYPKRFRFLFGVGRR